MKDLEGLRSKWEPLQIAMSLILLSSICPAQNASSIVIQFLNGKNGKPISDKQVTIELGKGGAFFRDADSKGKIVLDIGNGETRELRVRPDYYFDCRFKHDQMGLGGLESEYSLDEIISKGVVGNNFCGKPHVLATPGVLTLYLRPRTLIEGFKL
jgi:hypothetical protein